MLNYGWISFVCNLDNFERLKSKRMHRYFWKPTFVWHLVWLRLNFCFWRWQIWANTAEGNTLFISASEFALQFHHLKESFKLENREAWRFHQIQKRSKGAPGYIFARSNGRVVMVQTSDLGRISWKIWLQKWIRVNQRNCWIRDIWIKDFQFKLRGLFG